MSIGNGKIIKNIEIFSINEDLRREILDDSNVMEFMLYRSDEFHENIVEYLLTDNYWVYSNLEPKRTFRRSGVPKDVRKSIGEDITTNLEVDLDDIPTWEINEAGLPDLLVWSKQNKKNYFFLEVKSKNGKLSRNQIRWISKYDFFDTYVIYLELEEIQSKVLRKIERKIEKFKKDGGG